MSGDVQPRKRKDKRKRKDDSDIKEAATFMNRKMSEKDEEDVKEKVGGINVSKMEDIQLHVHSDHGTGGHWCAKIFFFSLMAILLGLIGLILIENRGLSDLDTPLSESRYADYLEGWVDEKRENHDEHEVLESLHELDEHDHDNEPFAEEEDHDDDDDDHDSGINEDSNHSEEVADDQNEPDEIDHDDDDDQEDENDEKEEENNLSEEDDDNIDADSGEAEQQENVKSINGNYNYNGLDQDDDDDDDKDDLKINDNSPFEEHANTNFNNSKQSDNGKMTADKLKSQVDDLYDVYNKLADSLGNSNMVKISSASSDETIDSLKIVKRSVKEDDVDDDDDDDIDVPDEKVIDNDEGEELHLKKLAQKNEVNDDDEEAPEEQSSLAVKIGVGIIFVVVAHLVFVKQWQTRKDQTDENNLEEQTSMRRRFTIVSAEENVPSDDEDIEPLDDEDYENDEDFEDDKYDDDDEDEEVEEVPEKAEEEEEADGQHRKSEVEKKLHIQTFEEMANLYRPQKLFQETEIEDENSKEENIIDETEGGDNKNENSEYKTKEKGAIVDESENDIGEVTNVIEVTWKDIEDMKKKNETCEIADKMRTLKNETNLNRAGNDDEQEDEENEDEEIEEDDYEEEEELDEDVEYEEEISDVDDSDLMKRLDSKYGKLPGASPASDESDTSEGKSWTKVKKSGAQSTDDFIEEELRRANALLDDRPSAALMLFEMLLQKSPNSSEILYGIARSLDRLAEIQKSNDLLNKAIDSYIKAIEFGDQLSDAVYKMIAERCINRMRFIGQHFKAVPIHELLIKRFDDEPSYRNELAITYLLINRLAEAKLVLHNTLLRWRNDGFAAAHYGFVLKNLDKNMEKAIIFLREGIASGAKGTSDGRFYFNLGDALQRLGRNDEAMDVFHEGAAKKLFLSAYQRSLYNVDRLVSRPFWTKEETGYKESFNILEKNWEAIRNEGLSILNEKGYFTNETENLRDVGDWKQFDLFARGRKIVKHCDKAPFTCKIIDTFSAARFCTRGQVKFSVMHPGTHIWPHCGPTNCRIRAHLGLKVPEKTFLRVATETRSWSEGQMLIFDDSFEHEVWHNGTNVRLVLIVDVWHPDLTDQERNTLYPI